MIKQAIARVVEGRDLTREEAAGALGSVMEGEATAAQIAALLVALRIKGETVEEIVGCAEAMRARMRVVRCTDRDAVDTCGTGGDGAGTFNLSTAAAFVAAGAGVTVAKHGNHGVSSRCGSADLLERAGVLLQTPPERIERSLEEARIAFLYAPMFHPAVRHAVGPRRELGLRTLFNALGPLANPARVSRQVVGVYSPDLVGPLARALGELGSTSVMVVHGEGGLDEISPAGETLVAELRNGRVVERAVTPEQAGLRRWPLKAIRGGDADTNCRTLRDLLDGRGEQALEEAVFLNASAALFVAGRVGDLAEGVEASRRSIHDGAAARALERAAAISRGEA